MSSKTVAQKMHIKAGMKLGFYNAPENIMELLGGLPDNVNVVKQPGNNQLDIVLGFIKDRNMLKKQLPKLKESIKDNGALWLAYHKGSSSVDTDINRDSINKYAQSIDLKGVAMISINNNWSGLRCKKV